MGILRCVEDAEPLRMWSRAFVSTQLMVPMAGLGFKAALVGGGWQLCKGEW